MGSHNGCCRSSTEEDGLIQDRGHAQSQVEVKACNTSTEGCEPIHEGAVRLQSQACVEDSEGAPHEEVEGTRELIARSFVIATVCTFGSQGRGGRTHRAKLVHCTNGRHL